MAQGKCHSFCWHIEYHPESIVRCSKKRSAKPKEDLKPEPIKCIYRNDQNTCLNVKCKRFHSTCSNSACSFAKKNIKNTNTPNKNQSKNKKQPNIVCHIKKGTKLESKILGIGKFLNYDKQTQQISVRFESGIKFFIYPDVINSGKLKISG